MANEPKTTPTQVSVPQFLAGVADPQRREDAEAVCGLMRDVTGVEPMAHASPVFNVWEADTARAGLPVEAALRNAPAQRQHMIVVPKVVE